MHSLGGHPHRDEAQDAAQALRPTFAGRIGRYPEIQRFEGVRLQAHPYQGASLAGTLSLRVITGCYCHSLVITGNRAERKLLPSHPALTTNDPAEINHGC